MESGIAYIVNTVVFLCVVALCVVAQGGCSVWVDNMWDIKIILINKYYNGIFCCNLIL